MAEDVSFDSITFKLRAGSPMPIGYGNFVTQTFMVEKTSTKTFLYTESLNGSDDFRGQGGAYMNAQFSRLMSSSDSEAFKGSITSAPTYEEETVIG
jgi:hypothetical protein